MYWSVPSRGRSSSNHSKPGVFSTAPARPLKRSSKRSCLSLGTVIALILTTLMSAPFPAGRPVNPASGRPRGDDGAMTSAAPATRPGVLFDVDGTLLDTNYLQVLAW